jgi:hypothetical protein
MNWRRMVYTGLVNTAVGLGLGLVLGKMAQSPYTSTAYQRLGQVYLVVGGVGGFIVGWSWEGLRQLKEKRDWEESQRSLSDGSDRR